MSCSAFDPFAEDDPWEGNPNQEEGFRKWVPPHSDGPVGTLTVPNLPLLETQEPLPSAFDSGSGSEGPPSLVASSCPSTPKSVAASVYGGSSSSSGGLPINTPAEDASTEASGPSPVTPPKVPNRRRRMMTKEAQFKNWVAKKAEFEKEQGETLPRTFYDQHYHNCRYQWCCEWEKYGPGSQLQEPGQSKVRRYCARRAWRNLNKDRKRNYMLKYWRYMNTNPKGQQGLPHAFGKKGLAQKDENNEKHVGPTDNRHGCFGYLLTWHDHSLVKNEAVKEKILKIKACDPTSREWKDQLKELGNMDAVVRCRDRFIAWVATRIDETEWPEESYQHEISFNSAELGSCHHHVAVSRLCKFERGTLIQYKKEWTYDGESVNCQPNRASGRHVNKSIAQMHAYCQVRDT